MSPIQLDYDAYGNCIGGHAVLELPEHHLQHYHPPAGVMAQQDSSQPPGPQGPPPSQQPPPYPPPHPPQQQGPSSSLQPPPYPPPHQQMLMPHFNAAAAPANASFNTNMSQYAPFQPQNVGPQSGAMLAPATNSSSFRRPSEPHFEPVGFTGPPQHMNGGPPYAHVPQHALYQGPQHQQPGQFHHHQQPGKFHHHQMPGQFHHHQMPGQFHHHQVPQYGGPVYQPVGYLPQGPPGAIGPFHATYQPSHMPRPPRYRNMGQEFTTGSPAPRVQDQGQDLMPALTQDSANWEPLPSANQMLPAMPLTERTRLDSMLTQQASQQNVPGSIASPSSPDSELFALQQSISQHFGQPQHREHDTGAQAACDVAEKDEIAERTAASSNDVTATIDPRKIDSTADINALQDSADDDLSSLVLESTEEDTWMEKASSFVTQFSEFFEKNFNALASFEILCKNYMKDKISEVDFYAGVRTILARNGALHFMPGFHVFLPALWKDIDLDWLNKAVDFDRLEKMKLKPPTRQADVTAQTMLEDKPKKKRPMNAFSTSDGPDAPSRRETADVASHPPSPPIGTGGQAVKDKGKAKANARAKAKNDKSGLVKFSVNQNGSAVGPKLPEPSQTIRDEGSVNSSPRNTGQKDRFNYGRLLASQVEHFGPVYPTRRAVLQRESKPYVHNCGVRFKHPQDVRSHHHSKAPKCLELAGFNGKGSKWDDNPSCKADYPALKYTKVKDGYVIVDKESYELLEECIQAGLDYCAEKCLGIDGKKEEVVSSDDESEVIEPVSRATKPGCKKNAGPSASRKRAASTSAGPSAPAKKPSVATAKEDTGALARAAFGLRARK